MNIKAYFFLPLLSITLFNPLLKLKAEEPSNSSQSHEEVESFFDLNNSTYDESFQTSTTRAGGGITPIDILDFINDDILALLQKNFYKYTHPVNVRPLLELPSLRPPLKPCCCNEPLWNVNLFYNQTRQQYLTYKSPYIQDYLAFSDTELTDIFNKIAELLHPIYPDLPNIPDVLHLFDKIKFEERRAGAVFSVLKNKGPFSFYAALPLYFIEHNFYLTPDEQHAIEHSAFFQQFGGGTGGPGDNTMRNFLQEHLVHDFLGLGDARFNAMWNLEQECSTLSLGLELSLPTSAIITERLIGGPRCLMFYQPDLDIVNLINQLIDGNKTVINQVVDLGVNALDRLILVTGDTRLGEEQVRFGPRIEFENNLTNNLLLHQMLLLEYQPGYSTTRFYREIKTPQLFNRDYKNPADANQNLEFLEQRVVNMFYPPAYETHVSSTCSVEYTISGKWNWRCTHGELGYDLWYKTNENVNITGPNFNICPFDTCVAPRTKAIEQKIFGSLLWRHDGCSYQGWYGASFDTTIASRGIGKGWTLSLLGSLDW